MALGSDIGLLFKIKGDESDAVRALKNTEKEAQNLAKSADGISASFGQLVGAEVVGELIGAAIKKAATSAVELSVALFNLTTKTAEFGSQIFDASQKTGLSAQTLSAMKFAADQSGTSLEAITGSAAKFAKTITDAANGSDEAKAKLDRLKVTSGDLDEALGQALNTIVHVTPGTEQMAAAMDAFGRSGADLLPFIKSFDGDLVALTAKAKELGVTITDEDAKAADEFGDQLDTLSAQLAGVGRTIGQELMPEFRTMAQEVSDWLKSNPGEVQKWGESLGYILRRVAAGAREVANNWEALKDVIDTFTSTDPAAVDAYLERAKRRDVVREEIRNVVAGTDIRTRGGVSDQPDELGGIGSAAGYRGPLPSGPYSYDAKAAKEAQDQAKKDAEKAQKEADELRKKQAAGQLGQIKGILAAEQHALDRITAANKAAFDARLITSKAFLDQRLADEEEFAKQAIDATEKEYALRRKQEGLSSEQLKALKIEENNELQKIVDTRFAREEEAKKQTAEADKKLSAEQLAAKRDAMERSIDLFEAEAEKRHAVLVKSAEDEKRSAEDVAKFKQFLDEDVLQYRINKEKDYFALLTVGSKEYLDVQNKIKILEEELEALRAKNHVEDRKRHKERLKSWNDYVQKVYEAKEAEDKLQEQRAKEQLESDRKKFEKEGGLGPLGESIGDAAGSLSPISIFGDQDTLLSQSDFIKNVWTDLQGHIGGAIGSMVEGLGQMAAAWIATGHFSAKAALQMASSVALSLALQAGVAAIMELARGWAESAAAAASAAIFDYHGAALHGAAATMHFAAAAIYGTVAGVSAGVGVGLGLAARAVGGGGSQGSNSFQQTTNRGNRNTDGQGQAYSGFGNDTTIRNAGANAPSVLHIKIDDAGVIGKMFKFELERNGPLRDLIKGVAEG